MFSYDGTFCAMLNPVRWWWLDRNESNDFHYIKVYSGAVSFLNGKTNTLLLLAKIYELLKEKGNFMVKIQFNIEPNRTEFQYYN
jgi:hypothetical protein